MNKIAIIIYGNLRTFLMPTRESPNRRICDLFIDHIMQCNNDVDVFIFTDTNDFYYNGTQYYTNDRKIEILNNNACRIHDKIGFMDNETARDIITEQLKIVKNVKAINIEDPFNPSSDPKFKLLFDANAGGSSPTLLIHQFRKLKLAYNLLKEYEISQNISYNIILKWRFDISINKNLHLESYNYTQNDIYVAGIHAPIIYDWHAFGNRRGMDICLSIYDYLGSFLNDGPVFLCNKCNNYGNGNNCPIHKDCCSEITLAPEYHFYRALTKNNIKYADSGCLAYPYRYKDLSTNANVDDIINNLNIDATLVNYTPNNNIAEKIYKGK